MSTVFWKGYKMVHFVGAGSGAADLITIRGKKLLENADIIISVSYTHLTLPTIA